jgi:hypothetical protein
MMWGRKPPPVHLRRQWSAEEATDVYLMFATGMDTYQIARHWGLHESEIVRALDHFRDVTRGIVLASDAAE